MDCREYFKIGDEIDGVELMDCVGATRFGVLYNVVDRITGIMTGLFVMPADEPITEDDEEHESTLKLISSTFSDFTVREVEAYGWNWLFFYSWDFFWSTTAAKELSYDSPDYLITDVSDKVADQGKPMLSLVFRKYIGSKNRFNEVAGMDVLKEELKDSMFSFENRDVAEQYRIKPSNGVLLYGPPGCGKTYIAEKFAETMHLNYAIIKSSDVSDKYAHGTNLLIGKLFDKARENAPCILCLDEMDALVPDRKHLNEAPWMSSEVNEFLSQMNNCGQQGVFVIGTTNNPHGIDPAILRSGRLDKVLYVPMPDEAARLALLKYELDNRPLSDDLDWQELAKLTEGLVCSDITGLVNRVALACAKRLAPIGMKAIREVIRTYRPSVSRSELLRYEQIHAQLQGRKAEVMKPRIGFTNARYQENRA